MCFHHALVAKCFVLCAAAPTCWQNISMAQRLACVVLVPEHSAAAVDSFCRQDGV